MKTDDLTPDLRNRVDIARRMQTDEEYDVNFPKPRPPKRRTVATAIGALISAVLGLALLTTVDPASHGITAQLASAVLGHSDQITHAADEAHSLLNDAVWGDGLTDDGDDAHAEACAKLRWIAAEIGSFGYSPAEVLEARAVADNVCGDGELTLRQAHNVAAGFERYLEYRQGA